jgi:hypothetical protein
LITHFLGDEEVKAYGRDFARRLVALDNNFPKMWFLLGQSGVKIADVVFEHLPESYAEQVQLTTVYVDRSTREVKSDHPFADTTFDESPVLLIDSAVHSGQSMAKVMAALWEAGAKNVLTYSLMLKRSSKVIPTYFGILVEDTDRVYFQLNEMPNNRLCERPPFGILKEIDDDDITKEIGNVGAHLKELLQVTYCTAKERKISIHICTNMQAR